MQSQTSPEPGKKTDSEHGVASSAAKADRRHEELPVAVERRGGEKAPPASSRAAAPIPRERKIPIAGPDRRLKPEKPVEAPVCEEEVSFVQAMERYKRENRRPFPTWSEVLEVLRSLGYRKVTDEVPAAPQDAAVPTPPPKG